TNFGGEMSYAFHRRAGCMRFDTKVGAQWRFDDISAGLWRTTARERRALVYERHIAQTGASGYAKEDVTFGRFVTLALGARYDLLLYDVGDPHEDLTSLGTKTSGTRNAAIASPKASVVVRPLGGRTTAKPLDDLQLFGNF